jgi:sugar lactone lactonase YvrE
MMRRLVRPFAGLLVVCACSATLLAAGARFWEVATLPEFLKGEVTNLSIDLHGRLVLGPALTELAAPTAPVLWGGVTADDGTLYLGSGNEGQVLRVARDGKLSVFFDSAELEVHALAHAPGGGLYVGTSPDGRVYKVERDGSSTPFFDPEDKYIWALAVDGRGVVYAATGDKGLVYRITPDGKGEVFYSTRATHVRALHVAGDGSLLVGTESPGRVFRVTSDGSGFLLLDSGLQEVSALKAGRNGVVYAAALTGRQGNDRPAPVPAAEPARNAPVPNVSTEITQMAVVDQPPPPPAPSGTPRESGSTSGRGAVYRIQPDGLWDQVWSSADDAPYDVAVDDTGALMVATGGRGKIYRVSGEPERTTLLARAPAQQVTTLIVDGARGLLVATANPGKVFRLSARAAEAGAYESEVRDAESLATWGAISWRGLAPVGTDVRLFTRSGNTAAPDETWSPWSSAYRNPDGEQITSPRARYLQWKLELVGKEGRTPIVTSVTAAYLQRNLRPEITSITIHPPGVVFQKPFSSGETELAGFDATLLDRRPGAAAAPTGGAPPLGRRGYQKGLQTFIWQGRDQNEDDLSYDVLYRREGETSWKPLRRNLLDPLFVWDTTSVPNGTYVIKIVVTDAAANPPGSALIAERESGTFDIDNTPPTITVLSATRANERTAVRFVVRDFDSPVQRVEYALDANQWRPIYPKDGIADSRIEEFELDLQVDTVDKSIILRAVDAMNNVATGRAEPLDPQP